MIVRTINKYWLQILLFGLCTFCSSCKEEEENNVPVEEDESYVQAVDLGLSVKWASCNLGATKPEEYGDYYAWGETETKAEYTEENYQYWKNREAGEFVDIGNEISGTQYDVAHVKWGNGWRMPTEAEIDELRFECECEWIQYNGVYGLKITGPNGNSIFMPAAGYYTDYCVAEGDYAEYMSSSLIKSWTTNDYWHNYTVTSVGVSFDNGYGYRYYGYSVRPVKSK